MKKAVSVMKAAALLGQLGVSLITPPVVLALGAWWLQTRFDLGVWIMILAIAVGVLTALSSGYTLLKRALEETKPRKDESKFVNYHNHE